MSLKIASAILLATLPSSTSPCLDLQIKHTSLSPHFHFLKSFQVKPFPLSCFGREGRKTLFKPITDSHSEVDRYIYVDNKSHAATDLYHDKDIYASCDLDKMMSEPDPRYTASAGMSCSDVS